MKVYFFLYNVHVSSIINFQKIFDFPPYTTLFELNWTYFIVHVYTNTNGLDTSSDNLVNPPHCLKYMYVELHVLATPGTIRQIGFFGMQVDG